MAWALAHAAIHAGSHLLSLSILSHRVSKSEPLSEPSPEPAIELEAADPLGLGRAKRNKRLHGGPIIAIVAALAGVALAVGLLAWLWQWKGRSALAPTVGTVLPGAEYLLLH